MACKRLISRLLEESGATERSSQVCRKEALERADAVAGTAPNPSAVGREGGFPPRGIDRVTGWTFAPRSLWRQDAPPPL